MSKEQNDISRAVFKQAVKDKGGCTCPLCGQFAKIYKRPLSCEMAFGLIKLNRLATADLTYDHFYHVRNIMDGFRSGASGGGDFAKALHWGLIEPMKNKHDSKRCSGMWRLTTKGISFVKGTTEMPSHVFIYNGKPEGMAMETINIRQALHKRFDYAELMKS